MQLANISLEEYLLIRCLRSENCSQNDITEAERHLLFECVQCGFTENADVVGAINVLKRGQEILAAQ